MVLIHLKASLRAFTRLSLRLRSPPLVPVISIPTLAMTFERPPSLIGNKGPCEKRTEDADGDDVDMSSSEDYYRYISAGLSHDDAQFLASVPPKEQDRIFRKVDYRLVPCLGVLYFVAHLDRANIGNVKIEGLEASLGMFDIDYNIAVALFFIPYILCEVPSNYLLSNFSRPSRYMGFLVGIESLAMKILLVVAHS